MQSTPKNDTESHRGIFEALSKVRSETHKLRMQTRDLHRALSRTRPSTNCNTLRLLVAKQQRELCRAEVALAARAREVFRDPGDSAGPLQDSENVWGDCENGVENRIMVLLQAHSDAAHDAFAAACSAKDAHDVRSYRLLKRRADAHDAAAWTLGPMLITSVTACELCSARFTCPLRASLVKMGRRPPTERTQERTETAASALRT